jgi:hypothetical protein
VGNVQPLRPELASHALCQRTQARLRRGKVGEARFAAQAAGCAREDERAAPERRQPAGRLAADKEACKTPTRQKSSKASALSSRKSMR